MKAIIFVILVTILAVCLAAFAVKSRAAEPEESPIKVMLRCGSLVGQGEIVVMFEGEISSQIIRCGDKRI